MGVGPSSSSTPASVIDAKLETSSKTGVLNLKSQDIKSNSKVWNAIANPDLALKIKTLDLSDNPLKSLPQHISVLDNLKTLIVSKCNLQRTPNLSVLVELKRLDLDGNDLEEETIGPLPDRLLKLTLNTNHLVKFPELLTTLVFLQELDLSCNRLDDIECVGRLTALVVLNLDENNLVDLPESLGNLSKLKKITVKKNLLIPKSPTRCTQSIPRSLFTETAVETIELNGNEYLKKTDILSFEGIDVFLERRRLSKEKSIQGGAMTDFSLFGID
jgi:Leucine-rich repeat (LRR) protein